MSKDLIQLIQDRFKSGNSVDVERITITRAEFEEALSKPEPRNDAAWYWHDLYKAKCEEIEYGFDRTASHIAGEYVDTAQPIALTQAMRLYKAVERLALIAGEDTNDSIEWLCGKHGGMFKLYQSHFSPKPTKRDVSLIDEGKTWQGLTDDEIKEMYLSFTLTNNHGEPSRFVRLIEAKLKEKNT